uniref:Fucolectin tachylectin-4 pentraxin-1 domain-containing protein n=1 Tax=Xenopus tropicalis TaxID=8364 RepID=A0A1B8Y822_XENTR
MGFLLTAALLCIVSGTAAQQSNQRQNLALRGRATQSSTYYNYNIGYLALAANSNDGNLDSNYYHGSCSLTNSELSPWWRVDLLQPYKISQVVVTTWPQRCAQITHIGDGATLTFECKGMVGRFVNIFRPGRTIVQLCVMLSSSVWGTLAGLQLPHLIKIDNQKSR